MNRTIRTYDELIQYVRAFAEKESQRVMIVVGAAGLSKSTVLQTATSNATWLKGILSPWILYRSLHDLPDDRSSCVVIDDVDRFFKEKDGVSVLKQVFDTSETRTVMWNRANSEIRKGDVQASFETRARVCLICNELSRQNENVLAVHNRGYVIQFKPDAAEVHRYVGEWFTDEVVYDFVGEWLRFVESPSCRDYVIASHAREAGLNWQRDLLETWGVDDEIITVSKLLSQHFATERERVQAYKDETGKSQADYYRRAATLKAGEIEKTDFSVSQDSESMPLVAARKAAVLAGESEKPGLSIPPPSEGVPQFLVERLVAREIAPVFAAYDPSKRSKVFRLRTESGSGQIVFQPNGSAFLNFGESQDVYYSRSCDSDPVIACRSFFTGRHQWQLVEPYKPAVGVSA